MSSRPSSLPRLTSTPIVWLATLAAALMITLVVPTGRADAAGPSCRTTSPGGPSYSVKVCLTVGSGTTMTGNVTVTSTVTITGSSPGIRKLEFSLDGAYLLTDFQSPYTFLLPTASSVDGTHAVGVDVLLRDGQIASSPPVSTTFANGTTSPAPAATGFQPTSGRPAAPGEPFVLAATGDGASGQTTSDDVVGLIDAWNPNLFLYTGDVYEKGTETEFLNWYGQDGQRFGKFKAITNPVVGNHEYENGQAPGYFNYWSSVPDYYSYDAGGWHFIALNSNSQLNEFDPGSAQYEWLKADLKAHPNGCSLAYFHHPVLSIGPQGDTPAMDPIWSLMARNGVDIVLTGHEHQYQRWVPLNDSLAPDPSGMVQFVAGGGGHGIQSAVRSDPRVASVSDTTSDGYGALRMELSGGSAQYSYINPGGAVRDAGTIACSGAGPDTEPPSIPADVAATTGSGPDVLVSWSASNDNSGVSSYDIRRGTTTVATVPAHDTTWLDTTTAPLTAYQYSVRATDLAGNSSDWSPPVPVTTPDVQTSFTWQTTGDAYVDQSKPTTNLGARPDLRVDDSPLQRTYMRFEVAGIGTRAPGSVQLRVHAASNLSAGFQVQAVQGPWSESTIAFGNAPAVGPVLGTSGPVTSGTWVEIPITGLVSGDGTYDVALTPLSATALRLDARESGEPPELVADVSGSGSNAPPVASDLSLTTDEDTDAPWTPQVHDADSPTLTCSVANQPTSGHVTLAPSCSGGTYVPDPNSNGSDSFTYRVSDGSLSDTATVDVTVSPVNDPPTAWNVSGTAWMATSSDLTLSATDVDGDCPLTFEVSAPVQGSVSAVGPVDCSAGVATALVSYSAPAGWTGTDTFSYVARDAAGSVGQAQASVVVTAAPSEFTVQASADGFVSESLPTTNFGTRPDLRLDGSPVQRTYMRFAVSGLGTSSPTSLTLRIHAASTLSAGFEVRATTDAWAESTLTWADAPGAGNLLATSGPVVAGTWVDVALPTSLLNGDGGVDLVLMPLSDTALRLDSRETATPPGLVVGNG